MFNINEKFVFHALQGVKPNSHQKLKSSELPKSKGQFSTRFLWKRRRFCARVQSNFSCDTSFSRPFSRPFAPFLLLPRPTRRARPQFPTADLMQLSPKPSAIRTPTRFCWLTVKLLPIRIWRDWRLVNCWPTFIRFAIKRKPLNRPRKPSAKPAFVFRFCKPRRTRC